MIAISDKLRHQVMKLVWLLLNTAGRSTNIQEPILMTGLNIQFQRQTTGTSFGFL